MEIESWSDVEEEMVTRKYLTAILRKHDNYYYCIMKNTVILWYMVAARLILSHMEFETLLIP